MSTPSFLPAATSHPATLHSPRFHIQSQGINLNEWLAQFTLCFAPLAAHVLIGVPILVNRSGRPIPWQKRIPLLNPITILWRYTMILDRRIRCCEWTRNMMSAANAAFFDDKGWNSREANLAQQISCLLRPTPSSRVQILSVSMLGTLITVCQGLQALYETTLVAKLGFILSQGVAGVFLPLAICSILRLPSAPWITQDFAFKDGMGYTDNNYFSSVTFGGELGNDIELALVMHRQASTTTTTDQSNDGPNPLPELFAYSTFKSQRYWPSRLFRGAVLATFVALFVGQLFHIIGHPSFGSLQSVAGLTLHFLYHVMIGAMLVIFPLYWLRGKGDDLMIPCINSTWYLAFTVSWYAFAVVVVVISALEMRRTSCGVYTTYYPSSGVDQGLCDFYT